MKTFMDLASNRHSVRSYDIRPVGKDLIEAVLSAGNIAPSACNIQPWMFIVITQDAQRKKMDTIYNRDWFLKAPVYIVVCVSAEVAWRRSDGVSYSVVDAALAMDHMILAATDLGLGTCFVAAFNKEAAINVLNLPPQWEPILITPLGYSTSIAPEKKRKPLNEVIRWEHF